MALHGTVRYSSSHVTVNEDAVVKRTRKLPVLLQIQHPRFYLDPLLGENTNTWVAEAGLPDLTDSFLPKCNVKPAQIRTSLESHVKTVKLSHK